MLRKMYQVKIHGSRTQSYPVASPLDWKRQIQVEYSRAGSRQIFETINFNELKLEDNVDLSKVSFT